MNNIIFKIFGILGIGFLIAAFFSGRSDREFNDKAYVTTGKVIEIVEKTQTRSGAQINSVTYAPKISFFPEEKKEVTFVSDISSSPAAYEVGDEVDVYFDPQNPQNARVTSPFIFTGILLLVGGGLCGVALLELVPSWLRKRKNNQNSIS